MACDLILVLDAQSPRDVTPALRQLQGTVRWVKIGLEMFTACGPDCVREIAGLGFEVFLDLKLHDIPNTVAKAVESVSKLPIGMLTLHTSGGREMMQWAAKAQRQHAPDLLLLGVTVLTSMSAAGLGETGVTGTPEAQQVVRLGRLAADSGLRGLVCSPLEIAPLRAVLPADVALVTPGSVPATPRPTTRRAS
jgi:orotidine-5'-phosphate decarboxylase